jgi:hypothetical protein
VCPHHDRTRDRGHACHHVRGLRGDLPGDHHGSPAVTARGVTGSRSDAHRHYGRLLGVDGIQRTHRRCRHGEQPLDERAAAHSGIGPTSSAGLHCSAGSLAGREPSPCPARSPGRPGSCFPRFHLASWAYWQHRPRWSHLWHPSPPRAEQSGTRPSRLSPWNSKVWAMVTAVDQLTAQVL